MSSKKAKRSVAEDPGVLEMLTKALSDKPESKLGQVSQVEALEAIVGCYFRIHKALKMHKDSEILESVRAELQSGSYSLATKLRLFYLKIT